MLAALQAAVPLRIAELRAETDEHRVGIARESAELVASHGDDLLFGGPRRGDTARVFNAIALGLAVCAYQPGGVDFAGSHWCVDPHPHCPRGNEGPEPARPRARRRKVSVVTRHPTHQRL